MSVDYNVVGKNMSEVKETIIGNFIGGIEHNRAPRPLMTWGPPGEGKTFTTYAAAEELSKRLNQKVEVHCLLSSCLEPSDITGVPKEVSERYTTYMPPDWAYFISEEYEQDMRKKQPNFKAPPAILFWDDLPNAHPQSLRAVLKGIHEGMWGCLRQRKNVMTLAAGNRTDDNAGSSDMITSLANRFEHAYARTTPEDWLRWATKFGIHPYVMAHIRQMGQDLQEFCAEVAARDEKAFASPRSWHMVSDKLFEVKDIEVGSGGIDPMLAKSIFGIIGTGIGTRFCGFLRNTSAVIPPEEIVKDARKARIPGKTNLDALHATVESLAFFLKKNPQHWEAALTYALRKEMVVDAGVILARRANDAMMSLDDKARKSGLMNPLWGQCADKFSDVLDNVD